MHKFGRVYLHMLVATFQGDCHILQQALAHISPFYLYL